ncbi:MAG: CatB-related O-acetyltransferase [Fibrobacteres bacterium]|nr:CatB-related O-acetyltransferase [Fibrobacterota bacterium]
MDQKLKQETIYDRYPGYEIGRYVCGAVPNVRGWRNCASTLKMGSFISIATDVEILLGAEHRPDWVTTYDFSANWKNVEKVEGHPKTKGDVVIGNDVWIGTGVFILSGVTIGDGAVLGAKSVITKNIPPYSIYAGNPAKFIRNRFSDEIISELLRIKWWEWPDDKIRKYIPLLQSNRLDEFIKAAAE